MGSKPNSKSRRIHKTRLMKLQKGICSFCGLLMKNPTLEHIIPLSKGGFNKSTNLCLSCESCNQSKGDKIMIPISIKYKSFDPLNIIK